MIQILRYIISNPGKFRKEGGERRVKEGNAHVSRYEQPRAIYVVVGDKSGVQDLGLPVRGKKGYCSLLNSASVSTLLAGEDPVPLSTCMCVCVFMYVHVHT